MEQNKPKLTDFEIAMEQLTLLSLVLATISSGIVGLKLGYDMDQTIGWPSLFLSLIFSCGFIVAILGLNPLEKSVLSRFKKENSVLQLKNNVSAPLIDEG